jgi:hypothetical protein
MRAFGFADQYSFYGGYPGAACRGARAVASLHPDPGRDHHARDVLLSGRGQAALLRRLLEIGSRYSGQILS